MKIATWNVNSVRARMHLLIDWLRAHEPDAICLQETKVEDHEFPRELIEDEGYNVEVFGGKTYNGVAIAARWPIDNVVCGMPGDEEKRVIAATVQGYSIVNLYVPNGRALDSDAYQQKLVWLQRLRTFLDDGFDPEDKVVVTGDFNITFDDRDVWDPDGMREAIHCSTPEREALAHVMEFGLVDGLRRFHDEAGQFTWWHYRGPGLSKNRGLRIDHVLLSAAAMEVCTDVEIDVETRRGTRASDHAPVYATFSDIP
ncbi:MAG: exodeoxyribonuclease III [Planctomycetota bacterium]